MLRLPPGTSRVFFLFKEYPRDKKALRFLHLGHRINFISIEQRMIEGVTSILPLYLGMSNHVASKIQKVYNSIVKRLKEAFNFIKSLGSRMLSALLKFLGFVPQVKVSGGGAFPL